MATTTRRVLLYSTVILSTVVVGIILYFYTILNRSLPQREGTFVASVISDTVTVTFDEKGIPNIWGHTENDVLFATGFVTAGDRLFQMDLSRRLAQGRLSELLGDATIQYDKTQRRIGHARLAKKWLGQLSSQNRERMESYVAGINAYITSGKTLPIEYHLLRQSCELWTLQDCLAFFIFQTWFANALQSRDEFFVRLTEKVGAERARTLCLPYPDWAPVTVPSLSAANLDKTQSLGMQDVDSHKNSVNLNSRSTASISSERIAFDFGSAIAQELFHGGSLPFTLSDASNGWVLSPSKSAGRGAIMASDPHLDITRLPQFWYVLGAHVADDTSDALGITSPGLPFIVMGHNGTVSWCFTAAGIDVADYYVEQINPADSSQYRTPSGWETFVTRAETLDVAGSDSAIVFQVRETRNGPLTLENDTLREIYSLHWAGFDINYDSALTAAFALSHTTHFDQFRHTVTNLGALDANWFYADSAGNIGYQLGPPLAVRRASFVNLPQIGWDDSAVWNGFHVLSETPWSYNPAQGWLGNCNNKQDQANLSYELLGSFATDRILRLDSVMRATSHFSASDVRQLQQERHDVYFLRWQSEIVAILERMGETAEAQIVREWNGSTDSTSHAAAITAEFIRQLTRATFEDELGPELLVSIRRLWTDQIFHGVGALWIDDISTPGSKESRRDIAERAMFRALEIARGKRWGDLHTLTMRHPMAAVPILKSVLGLQKGPRPWGGSGGSLNASYYRDVENGRFEALAAPSWRFVIDLRQPDSAVMVLPAGQSGNPWSDHFFDFNSLWRTGEYWPTPLSKPAVLARAVSTLLLVPDSTSAKSQ